MPDSAFEVRVGHVLDVIREIPDESVACCVTSPPYWGLRNYGIPDQIWGGDPAHEHVWGEEISVNATNHTDKRRWNHTRNGRGEEQPTDKRVAWLRTDVGQGTFCECGAWRGSLGLEPTPDLFVAHCVDVFREVRRILKADGTLWLNIGDSYAPSRHAVGLKPKDLVGIPWMLAFALRTDGWWLRQDIIWSKPNPMPESVTDRCTKAHEYLFLMSKSERYHYDGEAIKESSITGDPRKPYAPGQVDNRGDGHARGGGRPRTAGNKNHKYVTEYEQSDTEEHRTKAGLLKVAEVPWSSRNKRSVWTIATQPTPEAHFATYPIALAETCILAGCPVGEICFDPFSGAGTTGLAAIKHGRRYLGIELNPEYAKITVDRTERHAPLFA